MKRNLLLAFGIILGLSVYAQSPLLMTIDNDSIYVDEFERIYKKNNANPDVSTQALEEYLDLFINYKLKVKEAYARKYDTVKSFQNELLKYRYQLSRPYLGNKNVTKKLIEEAYDRLKQEVHASHILIKLPDFATPQDTLAAFTKISGLKKRVDRGEDFSTLARAYSEDPSSKVNGGDLGWFSCFNMVYPFENAAYETPQGQVSKPFRTTYGYHIVKVHGKRKSKGQVKVAHLLIREYDKDPASTKELNKKKIQELYSKLKNGEDDFESLVRRFSDDKTTSSKGGVLPFFGVGKMVEEFEKAAFDLKNLGDISEPVQTSYGWHLIKLIQKDTLKSLEEEQAYIEDKITMDSRSLVAKKKFIEQLKEEYNFKKFNSNIKRFIAEYKPFIEKGNTSEMKPNKNRVLASWNGEKVSENELLERLSEINEPIPNTISSEGWLLNYTNKYFDSKLYKYEDDRLESKHPDFKALMQEYKEGILLFNLTNDLVWQKSISDTNGLTAFHEQNKQNFMWGNRVNAIIYSTQDQALLKKLQSKAKKKTKNEVLTYFNTTSTLTVGADSSLTEIANHEVLSKIPMEKGVFETNVGDTYYVVKVIEVLPSAPKALSEAKGAVIAAYQDKLEADWINDLREKFSIQVHKEALKTLQ